MTSNSAPTRSLEQTHGRGVLVAASLRLLAQGRKASEIQPLQLTLAAGLPPSRFQECYDGQADFQIELFQHLLDLAREAASQAVADLPRGVNGLKRGVEAYLDTHVRYPAMRELTLCLRDQQAAQAIIHRRVAGFHRVLQVGLSSLRVLYPLAAAQLITAMVVETTQAEYEARKPLPELRECLYAYLDRLVP